MPSTAQMRSSLTQTLLLSRTRPTRPEYEDSFGEKLNDLQDRSRWEITGRAQQIWHGDRNDGLLSCIIQTLQRQVREVYKGLPSRPDSWFHCYMIGLNKSNAHPTVVVISPNAKLLTQIRGIIKADLKQVFFKMATHEGRIDLLGGHAQGCRILDISPTDTHAGQSSGVCGAELIVDESNRRGTLGGIIKFRQEFYGLTAAHLFEADDNNLLSQVNPIIHFYDSDSEGNEEQEAHNLHEIDYQVYRLGTSPPSIADSLDYSATSEDSGSNSTGVSMRAEVKATANNQADSDQNYDWALLEAAKFKYHVSNQIGVHFVSQLEVNPPKGKILVQTRRGLLHGIGDGITAHVGSTKILEPSQWSLQLKSGYFELGDSGSWVIDATTGRLYGMLVAGCALLGTGYIMPMMQIFDDIEKSLKIYKQPDILTQETAPSLPTLHELLYMAAFHGKSELVHQLLNKSADVNAKGEGYKTALQSAAARSHEAVVMRLLDEGASVNLEGERHNIALQVAAARGHVAIVRLLLDRGADIDTRGTALQAAAARGHEAVVMLLLDEGASVNLEGERHDTALQLAAAGGHEEIVRLLLDRGADINAQGGGYGSALQVAAAGDHEEIVRLLLDRGADINAQSGEYGSALQGAAAEGPKAIAKLLNENQS